MCDSVTIRPFQPGDQAAAKALVLAGLAAHWGALDPTRNPDLDDIAAGYAHGVFLVAEENGRIIGTGGLLPEADGVSRIVRMSVAADRQRRGVGRRMLQRLIDFAREQGSHRLVLETTSTWHGAIAFYRQAGFRLVAEQDGDSHFVLDSPFA